MTEMIDYQIALEQVLGKIPSPLGTVQVPIDDARGRVLAADLRADVDLPPFNKSAMDGFAVRAADIVDLPRTLEVVMDIPAGEMPQGSIGPGQAASIMTGAPVPNGADTVVQVEWTSGFGAKQVEIHRGASVGFNISPRGEIFQAEDVLLEAGRWLRAAEIGVIASIGGDPVTVSTRPTVAVLATGDELVSPGEKPGPGQIRNSNGPVLTAFLKGLGIEPVNLGIAPDDRQATVDAVARGLEHDCLLITGGVSAGAYDFVDDVLVELGVDIHLRKVAMKPGKPTVFGTKGNKLVFGLPGNPVSTMVTARVFVEPALRKIQGATAVGPRVVQATLSDDIKKKPDRLWFVHGQLALQPTLQVRPLKGRGSADLPLAARGDCLIIAPRGVDRVERGSTVDVVVWDRSMGL